MLRFIGRRVITASVAVAGVVTVIFVLARLIGDPVSLMMQPGMTAADVTALRHALHLDQPLLSQYLRFVDGALHGDFGISPWQGQAAFGLVVERLPATLLLTCAALGFAVVTALTLGTMAVAYPGSWIDRLSGALSLAGQSMPNFWLALMLVLLFSSTLHWLPPAGYGAAENLLMPALSLGLFTMARLMRLVQSELAAAMREDYVRTARAKGLTEWRVLLRHALRNAAGHRACGRFRRDDGRRGGDRVRFRLARRRAADDPGDRAARFPHPAGLRLRDRADRCRHHFAGRHRLRRAEPEDPPCLSVLQP